MEEVEEGLTGDKTDISSQSVQCFSIQVEIQCFDTVTEFQQASQIFNAQSEKNIQEVSLNQ